MLFFHNQTNFKNYFFVIDLHKWQCYTVSAIGREAPISIKKEDKNMLFFKKRVEAERTENNENVEEDLPNNDFMYLLALQGLFRKNY